MIVNVTQPDNGLASQSVEVLADDVLVGSIGPGETVTVNSPVPCCISARCGFYDDSYLVDGDTNLTVQWSSSPAGMRLTKTK